jgi:glycosyltransferase involved in cell wall biosynthesis
MPNATRFLYFSSQWLTIFLAKRWGDKILVLNNADKEYLVNTKGIDRSRICVVNGGVDYDHINKLRVDTKHYDGIFLGRFHAQKGIFDLVRIWRQVCEKKPNAKLCLIGSGPSSLMREVRGAIVANGLSNNIFMVGTKIADSKFQLLKSSKVFLCPSHYESFAIVIAEAMACGLPVVAYDLPIYSDIYSGNVSTVPLGDTNRFAEVTIDLLNNDELRIMAGAQGQKFIQKYDWDRISEMEYEVITINGTRNHNSQWNTKS